jgi:hypothetical protein
MRLPGLLYGVQGPDVTDPLYAQSLAGGVGGVLGRVNRCKDSKLILAGHSQSEHAIMTALPVTDQKPIVAVTLFGRPLFHAAGHAPRGDFDPTRHGFAAVPRFDPNPAGLAGRFLDHRHRLDPAARGSFAVLGSWSACPSRTEPGTKRRMPPRPPRG